MAEGFGLAACGDPPHVHEPTNPVLRYLAILSAARDFGVGRSDIERVGGSIPST
jgi:hypothetical protein